MFMFSIFHFLLIIAGIPKPTVEWRIDGRLITDYILEEEEQKKIKDQGSILLIRKDIVLMRLDRDGFGTSVSCLAKNNNISTPVIVNKTIYLDRTLSIISLLHIYLLRGNVLQLDKAYTVYTYYLLWPNLLRNTCFAGLSKSLRL